MNNVFPLEVKNLCYSYPNRTGFLDVSFHLKEGELLCLFGKNGSGKSTLLRVLSTLHKPHSGSFSVYGIDGVKRKERIRKYLFPVFDENAHFDFTTGRENLEFFLRLYQSNQSGQCEHWCKDLDLNLDIKTGEYSLGMKRKLYLLEAILGQQNILLLDEPSLGLDSETRDNVFLWMQQQKPEKTSILFGTNRVEEAKYAERILFIDHGRIKQISSVEDLVSHMLTVKIYTRNDQFVELIDTANDLPDLVKRYLSFGMPTRIEIIGGDEEMIWTKEALEKIERAPGFVRKMIYRTIESYAKEKGYSRITPEIVDEARGRFERK